MTYQKGNIPLPLLACVLIIALAASFSIWKNQDQFDKKEPTFTSVPAPTEVNDAEQSWVKYQNPKLGFELKHPATWKVEERPNQPYFVFLTPAKKMAGYPIGSINIEVKAVEWTIGNSDEANFNEFLENCSPSTPTQCTEKVGDHLESRGEKEIDGKTGFITYGGCCANAYRTVHIFEDGKIYDISLVADRPEKIPATNQDIFDQVLASFRFIQEDLGPNRYSSETIKIGDKIGNFTVEDLVQGPGKFNYITFTGTETVSGDYETNSPGSGIMQNTVCFTADDNSTLKFPRRSSYKARTFFCFENTDYALENLGPYGTHGKATITIDSTTFPLSGGEVWSSANLVKVNSKN